MGTGPALILVGGAAYDGSENAPLAPALAATFTVYNYARRGRGGSGDTAPYAVEREIEDLAALIAEAGGTAHVYGASSGGALALEAAAAGLSISRLVVYEVPYDMTDDAPQRHRDYVEKLHQPTTHRLPGLHHPADTCSDRRTGAGGLPHALRTVPAAPFRVEFGDPPDPHGC